MKKQFILFITILVFSFTAIFAQDNAPKTISGGIVNGKAISLPAPQYPEAAKAVNASGAVSVQVLIDEEGNVISASAISGHPLLRAASEKAARNAKFRPTQLSGQPVKVTGTISYVFNLPKNEIQDDESGGTAGDLPTITKVDSLLDEKAKLDYMSIGAIIRLLTRINDDENLDAAAKIFFDQVISEIDTSDFPEDLVIIKELANSTKERRAEILITVNDVLRNSATKQQIWYINFGENAGDLIAETLKRTLIGGTGGSATKAALAKLKNSLTNAPSDFPVTLRDPLKGLIEFSEKNNLADVNILSELDDRIMDLGDIIFADSQEN